MDVNPYESPNTSTDEKKQAGKPPNYQHPTGCAAVFFLALGSVGMYCGWLLISSFITPRRLDSFGIVALMLVAPLLFFSAIMLWFGIAIIRAFWKNK